MYFTGSLTVDPSQLTHIEKMKPTHAFKKMLYVLTAGKVHDRMEHETFCAISILQQLNTCLRSLGITNVIRLAKDNLDFYLDEAGKKDDMKEAMEHFQIEVDQLEADVFKTLYLVLEHDDEHFKYLIEIKVNRCHKVGVHPISIEVNGLIKEFKMEGAGDPPKRMTEIFKSQDKYDAFQSWKRNYFNQFLASLEMTVKAHMHVDDISRKSSVAVIRPKSKVRDRSRISRSPVERSPVYHNYHGTGDFFLLCSALE